MLEIPGVSWREEDWTEAEALSEAPLAASWQPVPGEARHVFTHFALELRVMTAMSGDPDGKGEWWPIERIDDAGLPTLFARAASRAIASRQQER